MKRPRARPRFTFTHVASPDAAIAAIGAHLAARPQAVVGAVFERTAMLTIAPAHKHFWTPYLDLQVSGRDDGGSQLDGVFAPHPRLWTAFVGSQILFALLSLGLAIYVGSLWALGLSFTWPALAMMAALVGGGLSYGTAYIGQGLGSEQMYELRSFVDAALREVDGAAAA